MHDITAKARLAAASSLNKLVATYHSAYETFNDEMNAIEAALSSDFQAREDFFFNGPPKLPTADLPSDIKAKLASAVSEAADAAAGEVAGEVVQHLEAAE